MPSSQSWFPVSVCTPVLILCLFLCPCVSPASLCLYSSPGSRSVSVPSSQSRFSSYFRVSPGFHRRALLSVRRGSKASWDAGADVRACPGGRGVAEGGGGRSVPLVLLQWSCGSNWVLIRWRNKHCAHSRSPLTSLTGGGRSLWSCALYSVNTPEPGSSAEKR